MNRIGTYVCGLALLALLGLATGTLMAKERSPGEVLQDLNVATGKDVVRSRLKELLANKELARKLTRTALDLAKKDPQALHYNAAYVLALAAQEMKDVQASEKLFRICADRAVKLQSPNKLLEAYGGLIDLFYDGKNYEKSAAVCRELLELKTDDGKPRIVLQLITNRFGETDFVEDDGFDTARRLRPGVHRLMIQAIAKQGKYEQALKLVDTLVKASDSWMEHQLRAWVLREAGQYAESAKTYESILDRIDKDKRLEPEEKEGYVERFRYILSNVYVDLKQIDKAAEHLQWLLEKKPDEPGYNNDLGYIWADHDMHLEKAEKLVRKAIELDRKRRKANPSLTPEEDRDNGAYLDSLGWILYKQKRFKEAKEVLQKAVEDKNSQHIEIYDHLGDVLLALGEREAAIRAWERGLQVVGEGRREMERKEIVERKLEKHK